MNKIASWFRSKSITSHTIAVALLSIAGVIAGDKQVQDFLVSLLAAHPGAAAEIISVAVIAAKYSRSSSPAGTLATARDIKDSGNAPTAAQVDAASTK